MVGVPTLIPESMLTPNMLDRNSPDRAKPMRTFSPMDCLNTGQFEYLAGKIMIFLLFNE